MDGRELIEALNLIEKEKGIDKALIFDAIKVSLETACKKNYGTSQNIRVDINEENGAIKVIAQKTVVADEDYFDDEDGFFDISLTDARAKNAAYEVGDVLDVEITPKNFGRISAQTAKQVVMQKIREAEREKLYNEYLKKDKDIAIAIIQRSEKRSIIVSLGDKMEAMLPYQEQIPGEVYKFNDRIKVFIYEVKLTPKGPIVNVSRTHVGLVKRLFELEVPEVMDGTVEIKGVSREAGSRTKMAVYSQNPEVDAVGACVGQNGARVNVIVSELKGEKIDIVPWDEDPKKFIAAALNPAKVIAVKIIENETERCARVVVPDNQLSLAIGKEGQNVRLAARLTGWKIDIKSESQADLTEFEEDEDTAEEVFEEDVFDEIEDTADEETVEEQ